MNVHRERKGRLNGTCLLQPPGNKERKDWAEGGDPTMLQAPVGFPHALRASLASHAFSLAAEPK